MKELAAEATRQKDEQTDVILTCSLLFTAKIEGVKGNKERGIRR